VYAVQSSEDEEDQEEDTPAERLVKRFWRVVQVLLRTQLVQKLRKAINPPVTAVFAGGCGAASNHLPTLTLLVKLEAHCIIGFDFGVSYKSYCRALTCPLIIQKMSADNVRSLCRTQTALVPSTA
jgi:hypothetical protein